MSSPAEGFRRLFPAPRRRPGLLSILVRWRIEVVITLAVVAACWYVGYVAVLVGAAVLAVLVTVVPALRSGLFRLLLAIVIPHRVRSGLVQAGVTDRAGRLPWVVSARAHGETIHVRVWLRSGTTLADLRGAAGVIASACGAAEVEVTQLSARQDRAVVVIYRPRWGWPGR